VFGVEQTWSRWPITSEFDPKRSFDPRAMLRFGNCFRFQVLEIAVAYFEIGTLCAFCDFTCARGEFFIPLIGIIAIALFMIAIWNAPISVSNFERTMATRLCCSKTGIECMRMRHFTD
jgi:hypothetical protein